MSNLPKVRLGFVGVGTMGQAAHLRNYASLPECEIVALAELRPRQAQAVAARYGVPRVYPDATTMIAAERLDGIVASQPFSRHGQIVPELLAAGVKVFIEKPLAASIPVARELAEADRAAGGKIMVGYHKRSDLATVRAKAEIERLKQSGDFGAMRYLRVTMPPGDWIGGGFYELIQAEEDPSAPALPLAHDPAPTDLGKTAFATYTAFVNYYIHQVNLVRHLLGADYSVAYADPTKTILVGRSASGVPISLEMAPYHTTLGWQEAALVSFDHGFVKLELPAPVALTQAGRVEIYRGQAQGEHEQGSTRLEFPPEHAMRSQARNFLRFVRGEAGPTCTAAEALADLEIALAWLKFIPEN